MTLIGLIWQGTGVELVAELRDLVGDGHVFDLAADKLPYETDHTGRMRGRAAAVVRPLDTDQVAAVLTASARHGVGAVPRGGNTGLAGGTVPQEGSLVVSLERLQCIDEVDALSSTVVADAGVSLDALQQVAGEAGLFWPVDHAARSQATVGGSVATNAGGPLAWRFGMTRSCVVGLEIVLAGGRVLSALDRPLKSNAGLDLTGLMCGSEGTLGIVTRARLRLNTALPRRATALIPAANPPEITRLFLLLRRLCPSLLAVDFMSADAVELGRSHAQLPAAPFASPVYLVVECAAVEDPTDELGHALSHIDTATSAVAQDEDGRRRLWAYREMLNKAVTAAGGHKFDVSLPLAELGRFLHEIEQAIGNAAPGSRVIWFGHAGDGNVHLNVLDAAEHLSEVEEKVYREVAARGGSISAEHGIGRLKSKWLNLARSTEEIDVMRSLKQALDPNGLMNPGVMLPP